MTPSLRVVPPPERRPVIESAVLGTVIFIGTEVMLFAGLISALVIVKANHLGPWPPPDQPRLPIEATAFNTAMLFASGVALHLAWRGYKRKPLSAKTPFAVAIGLGAFFVVFQGVEWVQLIAQGLTLTSSTLGAFFYLIVGMHALHAFAALIVLCSLWLRLANRKLQPGTFLGAQIFWYFVVGLWPILYVQVYL
jgi:cytochrome c oxidase subunit 3